MTQFALESIDQEPMMTEMRPHYRSVASDNTRWEGFRFRPDDIVISTPPKCGTTWLQMICGLLIFQDPTFDRPLAEISPWLDMVIRGALLAVDGQSRTTGAHRVIAAIDAAPFR